MISSNTERGDRRPSVASRRRAIYTLGGLMFGSSLANVGSARGVTEIDSSTIITEPGRYVLTSNIRPQEHEAGFSRGIARIGIAIRANNVRLDGNGYSVQYQDSRPSRVTYGVQANDVMGITVQNVQIQLPDTISYHGVRLDNTKRATITNNVITDTGGVGFLIYTSNGAKVRNNLVEYSRNGCNLLDSSGCNVINNELRNNQDMGVRIHDSDANHLSANDIIGNEFGISLEDSHDHTITGNLLCDNQENFDIGDNVSDNVIEGNKFEC